MNSGERMLGVAAAAAIVVLLQLLAKAEGQVFAGEWRSPEHPPPWGRQLSPAASLGAPCASPGAGRDGNGCGKAAARRGKEQPG